MKKLLYLFLLISSFVSAQPTDDATMKTKADYIGLHTFDPGKTKALFYDLINNKTNYIAAVSATGTNSYTVSGIGAFSSITTGFCIDVKFQNDNTSSSSLTITPISSIPIVKNVSTTLVAGDIKAGKYYRLCYDGTNFQLNTSGAVGSTGDVQINLSGSTDASPNFNYDKTNNILRAATGLTITGATTRTDNIYLGLDHTDFSAGAPLRWNAVIGERHQIFNNRTSSAILNDDFIIGSFFNKLDMQSGGGPIAVSGHIGSTNSIIQSEGTSTSSITFAAINGGGWKNKISPKTSLSGQRVIGNWSLGGSHNLSEGYGSGVSGYWGQSSGYHSLVHGYVTTFFGDSFAGVDGTFNIDSNPQHTGTVPRILASGKHAINFSANSPTQTAGFGAQGDYSGIFAGVNGNAAGKNSVVLGGFNLNEPDSANVRVPYLSMQYTPLNDDALTQVLVRDGSTGKVKYKTASTFSSGSVPITRNINTTSPLSGGGDLSTDRTLSISQATTSTNGYLSSTDWNTFSNKSDALTNGVGTTANATAVDLGGAVPSDVNIDDNVAATHDFNIGNINRFNNININAVTLTSFADDIELNGPNSILSLTTGAVIGSGDGNTLVTLNTSSATFTDNRATKKGIEYSADYSSAYTSRSLVDKGFVTAGTLSNTATLNFASTASTAVADLTITVTGASVGDPCVVGVPNGSNTATATFTCWVSSTNTVTVRFSPKATEDPASGTFKVSVLKY